MTFEQKMLEELDSRAMFPDQAKEVMEIAKKLPSLESMADRWNDDITGYPHQLVVGVWMQVRHCGLQWIDENLPQAFFRPMFTD